MPKSKKRSKSSLPLKNLNLANKNMMLWLAGLFVLVGAVLYFTSHASTPVTIGEWFAKDAGQNTLDCQSHYKMCHGTSQSLTGGLNVTQSDGTTYYAANSNNSVPAGSWFWYGPYYPVLEHGSYTVCWDLRFSGGASALIQVAHDNGVPLPQATKTVKDSRSGFNGQCIDFFVSIGQTLNKLEFRIGPGDKTTGHVDIFAVSLYKQDAEPGPVCKPSDNCGANPGPTDPPKPKTGGPVATIQGAKVSVVGNAGVAGAAITYKCCNYQPFSTSSEPYFFRNMPQGAHRIHAADVAGYKLTGYTLCFDSTSCHGNTPTAMATSGPDTNDVVIDTTGHGYADLWFHYTPNPVAIVTSKTSIIQGYKVLPDNTTPPTPGLASVAYICCRAETVLNNLLKPIGADGNGYPTEDTNPFFFTNLPLGLHRVGIPNVPAGFKLLGAKICLSSVANCDINAQPIQSVDTANGNSVVVNTDDGQGNPVTVDLRWVFDTIAAPVATPDVPTSTPDLPVVVEALPTADTPVTPVTAPGNGTRRRCLILFTCTTHVKPTPVYTPINPGTILPPVAPTTRRNRRNPACDYLSGRVARLLGC